MKNLPYIISPIVFLLIGIVVVISDDGSSQWYVGITFILIGAVFARMFITKKMDVSENSFVKIIERALSDKPLEASVYYFLVYFGLLSLFNDVRVLGDSEKAEGGLVYLLSFALVVITMSDQKIKSWRGNKTDA
ncbi:MAG: hypothetical protein HQ556_07655 [Candidatus Marinimicrobia bacterium]|nr:hypothetical protein [Candidatus Neomarinimicrobiota bacterium]